jgi:hypothetical protein
MLRQTVTFWIAAVLGGIWLLLLGLSILALPLFHLPKRA